MKKFAVCIQFAASYDSRGGAYDLLEAFRKFLDKEVPLSNFDFQNIKLDYYGDGLDFSGVFK